MRTKLHRLRGPRSDQHRANRKTASERLGKCHDIGFHTRVLVRPEITRTPHAGLDFIKHEQGTDRIATFAECPQELGRCRDHAALALGEYITRLAQRPGYRCGLQCSGSGCAISVDDFDSADLESASLYRQRERQRERAA